MLKRIGKLDETIIILLLIVMTSAMALKVFFRYVLNNPLVWTEELARYVYIWIAFLGAGYGVRRRCHIEMTSFINLLPAVWKKIDQVLVNVIAIVCYAVIIPVSLPLLAAQHNIKAVGLEIPMSFIMVAVPIGCSLLVIRLVVDTVQVLRGAATGCEEVYIE
jgi:TRAP-type C4-dicarboxylate transport system permease small subunit